MAYSDFTLERVKADFSLTFNETTDLFVGIEAIAPSVRLSETLAEAVPLASAISTEKAFSELIIAPILLEVRRRSVHPVSLFSGTNFVVKPEIGLTGFCDFILSRSLEQYFISQPVVTVVEAKNGIISSGLGQCAAEMVAAQIFNASELQIYGAVTTGTIWKFLKLQGSTLFIDLREYYLNQIDLVLGILATTVH
jgi:hypothetical protein